METEDNEETEETKEEQSPKFGKSKNTDSDKMNS
jgi:hypothetical protein